MRVIAVVNLGSGASFSTAEKADVIRIKDAFRKAGLDVETRAVQAEAMAGALRRAAEEKPDVLVVGGGDGSINAAVNILARTGVTMAALPLGGFNYFARLLGVPLNVDEAARIVAEGESALIDLIEVGGQLAAVYCSAGVFARFISERVLLQKRRGLSKLRAMLLAFVSALWRFPSLYLHLTTDGEKSSLRTAFLFVGNVCSALNPITLTSGAAEFQDGRFCLIVSRGSKRWALIRLALRSLFGRLEQDRDFLVQRASELEIGTRRNKRVRLSLDGEIVSMATPLVIRLRPAALRVMVPRRVHAPEPAPRPQPRPEEKPRLIF